MKSEEDIRIKLERLKKRLKTANKNSSYYITLCGKIMLLEWVLR